jgi:L-aminopeptidase/D-esterase-like protein
VPGAWNAITDVPGVEVGYTTLIEGDDVRTGVTAIHPLGRDHPGKPIPAGYHSQNGNGEMTGVSWIAESGTMNGPIAITNTHAVGVAHAGIVRWTVEHRPDVADLWLLPVAAETYDGYLNDANGGHVTEAHVLAALDAARSGPVEAGSVGGGTGMNAYEFKAGSGTASRVVGHGADRYTVGVFVQANFGSRGELVVAGVPVGAALADDNPMAEDDAVTGFGMPPGAGSCIAIVATDAPFLPDQCRALARRVTLGLGRTGASGSHFSGDLFLAVSTAQPDAFTPGYTATARAGRGAYDSLRFIPWGDIDPFFTAVVEATEEAVLDALVANEEMIGFRGHRSPALPRDRVVERLREAGRLA